MKILFKNKSDLLWIVCLLYKRLKLISGIMFLPTPFEEKPYFSPLVWQVAFIMRIDDIDVCVCFGRMYAPNQNVSLNE